MEQLHQFNDEAPLEISRAGPMRFAEEIVTPTSP